MARADGERTGPSSNHHLKVTAVPRVGQTRGSVSLIRARSAAYREGGEEVPVSAGRRPPPLH